MGENAVGGADVLVVPGVVTGGLNEGRVAGHHQVVVARLATAHPQVIVVRTGQIGAEVADGRIGIGGIGCAAGQRVARVVKKIEREVCPGTGDGKGRHLACIQRHGVPVLALAENLHFTDGICAIAAGSGNTQVARAERCEIDVAIVVGAGGAGVEGLHAVVHAAGPVGQRDEGLPVVAIQGPLDMVGIVVIHRQQEIADIHRPAKVVLEVKRVTGWIVLRVTEPVHGAGIRPVGRVRRHHAVVESSAIVRVVDAGEEAARSRDRRRHIGLRRTGGDGQAADIAQFVRVVAGSVLLELDIPDVNQGQTAVGQGSAKIDLV